MASYRCTSNLEVALLVHQVFELLWYDSVGKKKGVERWWTKKDRNFQCNSILPFQILVTFACEKQYCFNPFRKIIRLDITLEGDDAKLFTFFACDAKNGNAF